MITPTREHGQWTGTRSIDWDRNTISSYDAVVIATAHSDTNFNELAEWANLIVDTRNAMGSIVCREGQLWKS